MPLWKCCASQMMPGAEEMHYPPVFTHCVDVITRPVEAIQRRLSVCRSSHPLTRTGISLRQVSSMAAWDSRHLRAMIGLSVRAFAHG